MNEHPSNVGQGPPEKSRAWARRFGYALRGVTVAVLTESNFLISLFCAVAVAATGAWIGLSAERWSLVALATAFVLVAEMFNSSIEHLARAITSETHPEIRDALDVASGAVLVAAIGAATVGAITILPSLAEYLM